MCNQVFIKVREGWRKKFTQLEKKNSLSSDENWCLNTIKYIQNYCKLMVMNKNNRTFRKQHYSSLYFYSSSICIDWGGEVPIPQGCDTKGILVQPVEKKHLYCQTLETEDSPLHCLKLTSKKQKKRKHPSQLKSLWTHSLEIKHGPCSVSGAPHPVIFSTCERLDVFLNVGLDKNPSGCVDTPVTGVRPPLSCTDDRNG